MIRAGARGKDGPLIVAGLSEGNIMRLKAGQPIKAPLRSFGPDLPGNLVIFYGKTEAEMEAMLRQHGLITEGTHCTADPQHDREMAVMRDHKKVLVATVGLPRSGKSTWARSQAYPVVNPDAIRIAIHGQRYCEQAEPWVWATAKAMTRALFLAGHDVVILDATNTTRKWRDEWRSKEWGLFFKVIDTPRNVCLARAEAEGDKEIVPVIERMAAGFEALANDEPHW